MSDALPSKEFDHCTECGMSIAAAGEYHPYAACLMFRSCQDAEVVRINLLSVQASGAQAECDLRSTLEPRVVEPFAVKHYANDERPSIKGNGFDGLEVGEDRQEAEEFVAWINARLAQAPANEEVQRVITGCRGAYRLTQQEGWREAAEMIERLAGTVRQPLADDEPGFFIGEDGALDFGPSVEGTTPPPGTDDDVPTLSAQRKLACEKQIEKLEIHRDPPKTWHCNICGGEVDLSCATSPTAKGVMVGAPRRAVPPPLPALELLLYRWLLDYNDGGSSDQKLYEETYVTLGLPGRMPELKGKLLGLPPLTKEVGQ